MTALKAGGKADLPTDLAVLPRQLSYRVSRNYVSLFLFACRSRIFYFLPLLLEALCICVVFEARTSTNNKWTFFGLTTNLFIYLFIYLKIRTMYRGENNRTRSPLPFSNMYTRERIRISLNNFILSTAS